MPRSETRRAAIASLAIALVLAASEAAAQDAIDGAADAIGGHVEDGPGPEIPDDLMGAIEPASPASAPASMQAPALDATAQVSTPDIPDDLMSTAGDALDMQERPARAEGGNTPVDADATSAEAPYDLMSTEISDADAAQVPARVTRSEASDPAPTSDGDSGWLEPANFTFKHEVAIGLHAPHDLVNNRTSFRIEYEKYLLDTLFLRFDSKLTAFWGRDHRALAEGRDLFVEGTSRDAYLQYSLGNTSVRVGRQVLIWGESDGGAITDVISPRNFSELFFIPLEEARIGQFMVTVDQFAASGQWGFFYVPEAQFNELPDPGTRYDIDPFQGTAVVRGNGGDRGEYGLRWKRTFGRSDISAMAARLIDNDLAFERSGQAEDGRLLIERRSRFDMLGTTFNYATGNWLFAGELAAKWPRTFTTPELQLARRNVLDASMRGEYSLGKGGAHSVSLEMTNSHVRDWNSAVGGTRNAASMVLGWNNTFFNEDLTVNLLSVYNRPHTSLLHSLFMTYEFNDTLSFNLDVFYLDVDDRDSTLYPYRRQNNAVFRVVYQF